MFFFVCFAFVWSSCVRFALSTALSSNLSDSLKDTLTKVFANYTKKYNMVVAVK